MIENPFTSSHFNFSLVLNTIRKNAYLSDLLKDNMRISLTQEDTERLRDLISKN